MPVGHGERRAARLGDRGDGLLHLGGNAGRRATPRAWRSHRRRPCGSRARRGRSRSSASARRTARTARSSCLQLAARAGRSVPWPARRSSGPPASRRPGSRAAPTSASSSARTPGAGRNSVAMRLPSVMVPVLSSRIVSTSPAASTARPLMGMTLWRIRRSMPAMPMAESRPPMVVGIRHTSSATITGRRERAGRSRGRTAPASRRRSGR